MTKPHFKSNPKVCICLPTFNSEHTLRETLESIIYQQYDNFEVIVIDNASTDSTKDIVKNFIQIDNRIRLYEFDENVGLEGNLTRCIELAQGEYTAIYHSDDVYEKTIVAQQVDFLENNFTAGAVFTTAIEIDEYGKKGAIRGIPEDLIRMNKDMYDFRDIFRMILKYGNFLMCPSAMVRTHIYKNDIQIYNKEDFMSSADLDVWLRILRKNPIGIINQPLLNYRVSNNSFSYHYSRSRTKRHDMFLVLDYFINGYAKELLEGKDMDNYYLLTIKDNINRAISYLIKNDKKQAIRLLIELFSSRSIVNSWINIYHMKYFLIGLLTFILSVIPIGNIGRQVLFRIRYGKS